MAWIPQHSYNTSSENWEDGWWNSETGTMHFGAPPPGADGYRSVWDSLPGSSNLEKWVNARQSGYSGGMVELGDWAVKNGLLSPEQLGQSQAYGQTLDAWADNDTKAMGRLTLGAIAGVMTAGALGLGGAGAGAAEGAAAGGGTAAGSGTGSALAGAGDMFGSGAAWSSGTAGLGSGAVAGSLASALAQGAGTQVAQQALSSGGDETGAFDQYGSQDVPGDPNSSVFDYQSPIDATTPLGRILRGQGTLEDYLRIGGTAGATGLGFIGASRQADALRDIAAQGRADRAPFLAKSTEYLNDPRAYLEGPGKSSMDAVMRSLSVRGNPAGMPSSMALAGEYGLKSWLDATTGLGDLGLGGEGTRAQLLSSATGADANALHALGYGLRQVTQPQTDIFGDVRSLADLLKRMNGGGKSLV